MTPEYRLTLITETIHVIKMGNSVSDGLVALLLEPWPDLYWNAMNREGAGWINLLQAAAARIERIPESGATHEGLRTYSQDDQPRLRGYSSTVSPPDDWANP